LRASTRHPQRPAPDLVGVRARSRTEASGSRLPAGLRVGLLGIGACGVLTAAGVLAAPGAGAAPVKAPPTTAAAVRPPARSTPPTTATTRAARPTTTVTRAPATTAAPATVAQPPTSLIASESEPAGDAVELSPGPPALLVAGPVAADPDTGKLLTPMTKLWLGGAAAALLALVIGLCTFSFWRRTRPGAAPAGTSDPQPAPHSALAARHWADSTTTWDEWSTPSWDPDAAWQPYDDPFLTEPAASASATASASEPPTSEQRVLVDA
jgi:hypothetical protein